MILFNVNTTVISNQFFRNTLWTGEHMQLTVMSLMPGEDIGMEIHEGLDQFLLVVEGFGMVLTGCDCHHMEEKKRICPDTGIIIPADTYHNVVNNGRVPMKLLSVYAPPAHRPCTVHETKQDAMEAEH